MPGNLEASIIIDDLEQLGTFRPFGKSTAIMVHGDVWGDEFDLNLFFQTSAAWAQFRRFATFRPWFSSSPTWRVPPIG